MTAGNCKVSSAWTALSNLQKRVADAVPTSSQGVYVRVIGQLKAFNNKRSINAQVLYLITDNNEIQYHMLEAIYVHLYHTRGPPPASHLLSRVLTTY